MVFKSLIIVVYFEKERVISGAGKIESWHRRIMRRKVVEDGSRVERKGCP